MKWLAITISTLFMQTAVAQESQHATTSAPIPVPVSTSVSATSDVHQLSHYLTTSYPSLQYVARYHAAFPEDAQGIVFPWKDNETPTAFKSAESLIDALSSLKDQHVAVSAVGSGSETLGVLFRSASDGGLIVWRIVDPALTSLAVDETVLTINGVSSADWLKLMAARTFGGNLRSRMAEAALQLALGSKLQHQAYQLSNAVSLTVRDAKGQVRTVILTYKKMDQDMAGRVAGAANQPDLPARFRAGKYRFASIRFGAFAPQFDPAFIEADEAATKAGKTEEEAMLAGFCGLVRDQIERHDRLGQPYDYLLVDLRGNLGGYGREARLLTEAIAHGPLPRSLDITRGSKPDTLKVVQQVTDPTCGHIKGAPKVVAWVDAGTRSSGELMAAWLWSSGALVVGERTIGAGGGRDAHSKGVTLGSSGYRVLASENFTFFDQSYTLQEGEVSESALLEQVAADQFAPSRKRPFAIQSVGVRPDIAQKTQLSDLKGGGLKGLLHILNSNMSVFELWAKQK